MSTYRISQLAERAGVPATTLRFYESVGLLPAERTASGYRVYDESAVERLAFISSAKLLGLPLEEIRELLGVWELGVCAAVRSRLLPLVADRIADAEQRIAELSAFTARLAEVHGDLAGPAPEGACGPGCGCMTTAAGGPVPVEITLGRPYPGTADLAGTDMAAGEDLSPVSGACTLTEVDQAERYRQWRRLLDAATARERVGDGMRVRFPADAGLTAALAGLAAAERECCAFFDFTLELSPAELVMTMRVHETAGTVLGELMDVLVDEASGALT